ncbi:hypothetical protein LF1_57620 [Rubripirellula obstinata]|uniref:Uncharacterized protein n=1 Tax=Rubripirellula obstinata TaxID=406547 RepID=A0A5B1CC95_9BACT|nr:hypothetical protein [Rubripirellula obstinata]KAA1256954.1 hypothetical protein LF1_57620 [Rubripirellula obstinata]
MKDCIYKWVTLMQPEVSFIFIRGKGAKDRYITLPTSTLDATRVLGDSPQQAVVVSSRWP